MRRRDVSMDRSWFRQVDESWRCHRSGRKVCLFTKVYSHAMPTTVKMRRNTKEKLDRLQARLLLRHGRKLTKELLLAKLIDHADADEEALLAAVEEIQYPLPEEVIEKIRASKRDWGVVTRSEEIDEYLYGGKSE